MHFESDIKLAEEKLGAIFPEQSKELFKLVNNAEIGEWILYPIKTQINPKFSHFYIVSTTDANEGD